MSRVPEVESAPPFFLESYPQPLSTAGDNPVDSPQRGRARPPVLNFGAGGPYTPQKNIFPKVKRIEYAG